MVTTNKKLKDLPLKVVVMHYLDLLHSAGLLLRYVRLTSGRLTFGDYKPSDWTSFIVWNVLPVGRDAWASMSELWYTRLLLPPVSEGLEQRPIDYLINSANSYLQ